MLHYTAGLKDARHQTEIGASVDQAAISEELVGICPETIRVLILQVPHLVGALGGIRFTHVGCATHQNIDLIAALVDDLLSCIQYEVDSLLSCDSANESKQGYRIVEVKIPEILFLDEFLGSCMIGCGLV